MLLNGNPTNRETLETREYYPVGMAPRQVELTDPYAVSSSLLSLIYDLRQRDGAPTLLMADAHANIQRNLASNDPEEARAKAHELAEYYKLMCEGIQDVADEEGVGERLPVRIMSEMVERADFENLMKDLRRLFWENEGFRDMVYHCVPRSQRPKRHRDKTLSELKASSETAYQKALDATEYVFQQISYVLLLDGKKLGHEGEWNYDRISEEAARLLGRESANLKFETVKPEGAEDVVHYAATKITRASVRKDLVSAQQDLGFIDHANRGEDFDPEIYEQFDEAEMKYKKMNAIYEKMIERAEGEMEEIVRFRYVREILFTLLTRSEMFRFIFAESGLTDVIEGKTPLKKLGENPNLLPFECEKHPDESDERYFLRYADALIHERGPVFRHSGEMSITTIICNKVAELMENHRYRGGGWNEEAGYLGMTKYCFTRYPKRNEYKLLKTPPDQQEQVGFKLLKELLDTIRGTDLENMWRRLMGLPRVEGLPEGDMGRLEELMKHEIWGDCMVEAFRRLKSGENKRC